MIRTLGEDAKDAVFEADVAIVGGGAMGLAMASELLASGLRVLLLEAGGAEPSEESDALFEAEIVGHPFNGTKEGRRRVLGGATTRWGGQFLPLGDIVFEERAWLGVSGWPLVKASLQPFYERAAALGNLSPREGEEAIWREHGIAPPAFDGRRLSSEFSRWSPSPNFANNQRAALATSPNVQVLLDAAVAEVRLDGHGAVEALALRATNGHAAMAHARAYVLAAGAIESARLLLASNGQDERGVGNREGLVGRYFQDHVSFPAARVVPRDREKFHEVYDNFILGATKYAPKVTLGDAIQREEGLLNVGGFFRFPMGGEEGVEALKTLAQHAKRRTRPEGGFGLIAKTVANLPEVVRFLQGMHRHRIRASRRGDIVLEAHAEQLPTPESRIDLATDRDRLGMPRARVDWRIDDASRVAIRRYVDVVREEFGRLNLADIEPYDEVIDVPEAFQRAASDVYHHMGTLRMSVDPVEGVTNPDARMHEVSNLYVAGCSLFPVSGYSNPTHTALALALRLTDRLRGELA